MDIIGSAVQFALAFIGLIVVLAVLAWWLLKPAEPRFSDPLVDDHWQGLRVHRLEPHPGFHLCAVARDAEILDLSEPTPAELGEAKRMVRDAFQPWGNQ